MCFNSHNLRTFLSHFDEIVIISECLAQTCRSWRCDAAEASDWLPAPSLAPAPRGVSTASRASFSNDLYQPSFSVNKILFS